MTLIHPSWDKYLQHSLDRDKAIILPVLMKLDNSQYHPDAKNIFEAFAIPFDKVNVVFLGNKPHSNCGLAWGASNGLVTRALGAIIDDVAIKTHDIGLDLNLVNVINPIESDKFEAYAETLYELRKHKNVNLAMAKDLMEDVSYFGTMMVHNGDADGMVSGAIHTTQHTIRPALQFIKTKPETSIVSSVFFMCLEDRVSVYGDCAINPNPTAEE